MKLKRLIIMLIIMGVVFVGVLMIGVSQLPKWLIVNEPLEKVDTIIVISGDLEGERVRHSVKLFEAGYANHLIISGCPGDQKLNEAIPMQKQAIALGVPPENISLDILKEHGLGTGVQAHNVNKIMVEKGFKNAILVTSNFHTRRSQLLFQRAFEGSNIKLFVTHPDKVDFNPEGWWKRKKDRKIAFLEFAKYIWYWFTFSGSSD